MTVIRIGTGTIVTRIGGPAQVAEMTVIETTEIGATIGERTMTRTVDGTVSGMTHGGSLIMTGAGVIVRGKR